MADDVVLLTGGTGAVGRELLPLLATGDRQVFVLTRDPEAAARVLGPVAPGISFVRGDILAGDHLGIEPRDRAAVKGGVTHVIHCAGDTRFTLPLEQARAVNVGGTRAVLDFARTCASLRAVACASTVYVAGTRTGMIREADVSASGWVNSYEQSKHEMEAVARQAMRDLPVSLCRFSTIIGHSVTGVVTSYNAIHHALRLFYQGLAPMIPGRLDTRVDLIPVDFAARALHQLVMGRFQAGSTYHLCAGASRSCTLDDLLSHTVRAFERSRPAWRKRRIERPAVVDERTYALFTRSVEESGNVVLQGATRAVETFAWQLAHPKTFDTTNADAALAGSGIAAPPVLDYYERVVSHCVESGWGAGGATGGAAA